MILFFFKGLAKPVSNAADIAALKASGIELERFEVVEDPEPTVTVAPVTQAAAPQPAPSNVVINVGSDGKTKVEEAKPAEPKLKYLSLAQLKPETLVAMTADGRHVDFNEAVGQAPAVQQKLNTTHALIGIVALEIGRALIADKGTANAAPMPAM